MLPHLSAQGPKPTGLDAADSNDDGEVDVADAIVMLSHLLPAVVICGSPSGRVRIGG